MRLPLGMYFHRTAARRHSYVSNNPIDYTQVIEEKDPLAGAGQQLKKVNLYGQRLREHRVKERGFETVFSYD